MEERNQTIKVGFDAKRLFTNRGGLASYARTLLLALRKHRADLKVYLYTTKITTPFDMSIILDDLDITVRTYKGPFSWYWRSKGLVRQLLNDGIDIYHGLAGELPVGIHKTSIRTVVTVHDTLWKSHKNDYGIADRIILNKKLDYAVKRADKLILISESTNAALARVKGYQEDKVNVIQQLAGPEFYERCTLAAKVKADYDLPDRFILAVGNNKRRKSISFLLKAMKHIQTQGVEVVIIGREQEYKQEVIHIAGLEYHEMPCVYSLADLCVYPSLNEGFGLPILESILCQTPVCARDKSPMNELVSPYLQLFSPEAKPKELAVLMDRILQQPPVDPLDTVTKYSSRQYAQSHIDIYQNLL